MTGWAVFLAALAALFLIGIPAWGAFKFAPHRARNVKLAETDASIIIEHVSGARLLHPEIIRTDRIDRHSFYLFPHFGVFCYALCVFGGAPLTSNVKALGLQTRYTMATCFLVGSLLVLCAATLGGKIWRWRIMPSVHDNLTSDVLGDDITLPYWLSAAGMFAVAVSMVIYSSTSFKSTTGSLGGWLTAVLAGACAVTTVQLYRRIKRFARWRDTLIADAITEIERRGDAAQ